jgi:hypothetical protein
MGNSIFVLPLCKAAKRGRIGKEKKSLSEQQTKKKKKSEKVR